MEAEIESVRVAPTPEGAVPVVLLEVDDTTDVLPIFIGFAEASAIADGLEAYDIGRPLTHDLMLDAIEELGGRVRSVAVSSLDESTYLADVHLDTPRGSTTIDARPSDSLALAARTNAPITVDNAVFEEGRRPRSEFEPLSHLGDATG